MYCASGGWQILAGWPVTGLPVEQFRAPGTVRVQPFTIHGAASAPGSRGRKRPMALMRSLGSRPLSRASADSLMLCRALARVTRRTRQPNDLETSLSKTPRRGAGIPDSGGRDYVATGKRVSLASSACRRLIAVTPCLPPYLVSLPRPGGDRSDGAAQAREREQHMLPWQFPQPPSTRNDVDVATAGPATSSAQPSAQSSASSPDAPIAHVLSLGSLCCTATCRKQAPA